MLHLIEFLSRDRLALVESLRACLRIQMKALMTGWTKKIADGIDLGWIVSKVLGTWVGVADIAKGCNPDRIKNGDAESIFWRTCCWAPPLHPVPNSTRAQALSEMLVSNANKLRRTVNFATPAPSKGPVSVTFTMHRERWHSEKTTHHVGHRLEMQRLSHA